MWVDLALQLSHGRDRTLSRRAARCYDLLSATERNASQRRLAKFEEFTDATPEGNLIRVYDERGNLQLTDPASPAGFPWPETGVAAGDSFHSVNYDSRRFRVLTRNTKIGPRAVTIQVGGQLEDNRQLLARFETGLESATPLLLVVSACCGYLVSRRALQPVDRLISGVRSISARDLSARLPVNPTGDELQRLAETCNDMLARLENAVARINRFTADASHELRSPLSFIRTVSEYALQRPELDGETRETFQDVLAESIEAGLLLENLLTLARADEGRLQVNLVPLDLTPLLEEVSGKAETLASAKGQTFTYSGASEAIMISGDRTTLQRLFWTLLDNALKYTPNGGRITLEALTRGKEVVVRVRDTGIGIPSSLIPRIFERFFRADPSRSHGGGAGLGLAIAKWIAEAHRATLTVESEQGKGSTFEVLLPTAKA